MLNGIDVSKHQGVIDWNKVREAGTEFAMIRAGYGKFDNQKDETFEANYSGAKAAGIKVGAYHYSYAKTVEDAKKEAQVFLKWIEGKQFEYPLALDVEEESQSVQGKQFVSDVIRTFCEEVENAGYYICIYANKYWLENYIDDDCKVKYDVWVAQWAQENTFKGKYGMWQFTSDGNVGGVTGRIDLDISYKNYADIMVNKGLNGYPQQQDNTPAPQEPVYPAKMMVSLFNTPLYISSVADIPSATKTGTFYIYDGIEINGRYRITNTPERALKKPISKNVTGFVNKFDIR